MADYLLLSGDAQSGTDKVLLSGDAQSGTDRELLSANQVLTPSAAEAWGGVAGPDLGELFRVSQTALETMMVVSGPHLRASQLAIETMSVQTPIKFRVSQVALEFVRKLNTYIPDAAEAWGDVNTLGAFTVTVRNVSFPKYGLDPRTITAVWDEIHDHTEAAKRNKLAQREHKLRMTLADLHDQISEYRTQIRTLEAEVTVGTMIYSDPEKFKELLSKIKQLKQLEAAVRAEIDDIMDELDQSHRDSVN